MYSPTLQSSTSSPIAGDAKPRTIATMKIKRMASPYLVSQLYMGKRRVTGACCANNVMRFKLSTCCAFNPLACGGLFLFKLIEFE
jgi:hypothetical protein